VASCGGVQLDEQGKVVNSIVRAVSQIQPPAEVQNDTANATATLFDQGTSIGRLLQAATISDASAESLRRLFLQPEDLAPVALPGVELRAADFERCEEGHTGLLCTTCETGFTRTGSFRCRECAGRTFIIVVMVLIVLLMLAIVGFVIKRTLMTKEREGRIEVMIMKIGVSHL